MYKWFIKYTSRYCYEDIKKLNDENFRVIYDKFATTNDYKRR